MFSMFNYPWLKRVLCFLKWSILNWIKFDTFSGAHELNDFNRRQAAESPAQHRGNARAGELESRGNDVSCDIVHK